MKYYLTLDVGGTQIKAGVLTASAQLLDNRLQTFDALSSADRETILSNFFHIIAALADSIHDPAGEIAGIGLAFPGDFDYAQGICLMKNVNKYDSIYGVNLKNEIQNFLKKNSAEYGFCADCPVIFLNDIEAFALGEYHSGNMKEFSTVMAVCIGTGAGSAFLRDGQLLTEPEPGVPDHGWIYSHPFRESILDDYLSRRGLTRISTRYLGSPVEGRELSELAADGDVRALQAFEDFGAMLSEGLQYFLSGFSPSCLVLGGQIMKSFSLFGKALQDYCAQNGISIHISPNTSLSAFLGLYQVLANA